MNLGVLSRNREYFPTTQLLKELEQRPDTNGIYLSTQFVSPLINTNRRDALFAGQSLRGIDGIIPRIGRTQTEIGILCLKQLELMNIPTTLSADALFIARDKFRCFQALNGLPGIKLPNTVVINNTFTYEKMISNFKFPVVIKLPSATGGTGTVLAPNRKVAHEIIEALLLRYDSPIMIQEYLRGSSSTTKEQIADIRVLVVGRTILGAMRRIAPKGEWRTNYAQGATCVPEQLTSEHEEVVWRIIERIGIEVAGIDLFPTSNGLYVLEVNACPGWKAFEMVHPDISVAKKIVDYIIEKIHM